MAERSEIAVVIPCYRVARSIRDVLGAIGPEVARIYVVDDACPEGTGDRVEREVRDPRVTVLRHAENRGVGGAMITGYRQALADGARVVVKIDGDGQMDPRLVPRFVAPILDGRADYAKGNRFHRPEDVVGMPTGRLLGNAALSVVAKFSSGYWNIFDPTNGYTAISGRVLAELPLDKIDAGYFFESDMLFRLNTVRAVVVDIPMQAKYGEEESNLRVVRVAPAFLRNSLRNCLKRIVYRYVLHDMSIATFELGLGILLFGFGVLFGGAHWIEAARSGVPATSGTVMLAALPTILGFQLLLAFIGFDVQDTPRVPLAARLKDTVEPG